MTVTPDPAAPDGDLGRRGVGRRRPRVGFLGVTLLVAGPVAVAGAVGWILAGPPDDGTAIIPPACPAALAPGGVLPAGQEPGHPGVAGELVPMILPEPRGPVSVRACGYRRTLAGFVLDRQAVLDPPRTAWLAGRLGEPRGRVVTPPIRPAGCVAGDSPVVLRFRYARGAPLAVEVPGGSCGLIATRARVETGRADVVRLAQDVLPSD